MTAPLNGSMPRPSVSIADLRKSGRAWKENGWQEADVDAGARALVEAARMEGARSGMGQYAPMTDAEWRHHRNMQNLQFAFTDAKIVLGAVKRTPALLIEGEVLPPVSEAQK